MSQNRSKKGFTLIEILVSMAVVSIIISSGFYAISAVGLGKVKLIEDTNLAKEMTYFSEKLYEFIKEGGEIDYEEYFARSLYDTSSFTGGHFSNSTLYGNAAFRPLCRSANGTSMGTGGCIADFNVNGNTNLAGLSQNIQGMKISYGLYQYQFIDYNSDLDGNLGDEDGDGLFMGDDDDEYLGLGPVAFSGSQVYELYLINGDKTKRTFLRWNVKNDPDSPSTATCTGLGGDPSLISGSGCLGTIEFLKLKGVDWGTDHHLYNIAEWQYDGFIDTWIFDEETYGLANSIIAGHDYHGDSYDHDSEHYWTPLFPDTVNISNFELFLYPNTDIKYAWKDFSPTTNIAPYVRIKMTLSPSWKKRKGMRSTPPSFDFTTTLALTNVFSK